MTNNLPFLYLVESWEKYRCIKEKTVPRNTGSEVNGKDLLALANTSAYKQETTLAPNFLLNRGRIKNMTNKIIYLEKWLVDVLIENPNILNQSGNAINVYGKLYEFWANDIQEAMKDLLKNQINNLSSHKEEKKQVN